MEEGDTFASGEPTIDASQAVDIIWIFFCLVLVTLMQPGFACYEVRLVGINQFCAYVESEDPFAETPEQSTAIAFLKCLYQWSFAAACTTIISGAVADRIPFKVYLIYAFLTSAIFYPILAYWVWADDGWLSATRTNPFLGCGVLDFAGSGVVHMCGGAIALIIAFLVRPRSDRFFRAGDMDEEDNVASGTLKNHTNKGQINEADFQPNDMAWMTLGCFLLWIGWYGFNCGSTLQISTVESQKTAGRAAMNTTIAAGIGRRPMRTEKNPGESSPGCATMSYSSAVWVSFVSALVYHVFYRCIICLHIDDAVGASAVHFACGFWGLLAAGFTATEAARLDAGYPSMDACSSSSQASANAAMAAIITIYAPLCAFILCAVLYILRLWRPMTDGESNLRPADGNLAALDDRFTTQNTDNEKRFVKIEEALKEVQSTQKRQLEASAAVEEEKEMGSEKSKQS
eukprot:g20932.t1